MYGGALLILDRVAIGSGRAINKTPLGLRSSLKLNFINVSNGSSHRPKLANNKAIKINHLQSQILTYR